MFEPFPALPLEVTLDMAWATAGGGCPAPPEAVRRMGARTKQRRQRLVAEFQQVAAAVERWTREILARSTSRSGCSGPERPGTRHCCTSIRPAARTRSGARSPTSPTRSAGPGYHR